MNTDNESEIKLKDFALWMMKLDFPQETLQY
jgi:hypothetical protein